MITPLPSSGDKKECPRCHLPFTCRADDIAQCDCAAVTLTDAERQYISEHFTDCVCADCMKAMKTEYSAQQH